MKFTVQKSAFIEKLAPAMGSVSNRNTITAIEGVLIETLPDNQIQISTYDMNKGYRAVIDVVKIEREGRFIINAQRLFQTVRVLDDDEVTFDINDKLNCTITTPQSSFSMFAVRGEEFPNLPDLFAENGFTVSADVIRNMILKVQHSIATQDTRPMLCGAYFKVNGNQIEAVSCNSYVLSKCTTVSEITSLTSDREVSYSFIIPNHATPELAKILTEGDGENVDIYLSRKHAIFKKDGITFFTRTIDLEYIDYNKIIPKNNSIKVKVGRERLLSGLERANIIADEKVQGSGRLYVKISIDHHYFTLTSESVNGTVQDEMDCIHEGREIEIAFNGRLLISCVKAAEGDNIVMTLEEAGRPITIEPAEPDEKFNYFYMVLPMRMVDNK